MGKKIFVSHASADKQIASQLVAGLEKRGLPCWIAPRDIPVGNDYSTEIVKGIKETETFLLVLSRSSADSRDVKQEVQLADRNKKPIAWLRTDDAEFGLLEYHISSRQGQDLGRLTEERLDELARLFKNEQRPHPLSDDARTQDVTQTRPLRNYALPGAAVALFALLGWFFMGQGPKIADFHAEPMEVGPGDEVKLTWRVENGQSASIEPLGGPYKAEGYTSDRPNSTQTYKITGKDSYGRTATDRITVQVVPKRSPVERKEGTKPADPPPAALAPIINSFAASPASVVRGGEVNLSWRVSGAVQIEIRDDPFTGVPIVHTAEQSGSIAVHPMGDWNYVLTATGASNGLQASQQQSVRVVNITAPRLSDAVDPKQVLVRPGSATAPSRSIDPNRILVRPRTTIRDPSATQAPSAAK